MTASLNPQFSDVRRTRLDFYDFVPPLSMIGPLVRLTRVGQTIWCCVEVQNALAFDAYVVMRPFFDVPLPEYLRVDAFPLQIAASIKRLDVIGPPSPFGTSISEFLGEAWRFFVPSGETRRYAFLVPSDGMALRYAAWATDVMGDVFPIIGTDILGTIWTAVGAAHALMVNREERAA